MASLTCRTILHAYMRPAARFNVVRSLTTVVSQQPMILTSGIVSSESRPSATTSVLSPQPTDSSNPPNTHFKITLRRSAISMGDKIKGTLLALGFHRRFQTVYHPHSPVVAGKILRVKELVEVENVPQEKVMSKQQQRQARKPNRGYKVIGSRKAREMMV